MPAGSEALRRDTLLIVVLMTIGIAVLAGLGVWQVQRLYWKEALIAQVEKRLSQPPVAVLEAVYDEHDSIDFNYRPVTIAGTYVPDEVFFEFTTYKGASGWNLFHLLENDPDQQKGGRYIIINRGFIPYDMRDAWQSVAPIPQGRVEITGLLRNAPQSKPGFMMPDNEIAGRTFYWRSMTGMAVAAGLDPDHVAFWYVDRGMPGEGQLGDWPVKGTTIVQFPNNHLQYAITWFGLALALLGVGSYFLYARRHREEAPS